MSTILIKLMYFVKRSTLNFFVGVGQIIKNFIFKPLFENGLITRLLEGVWSYSYDLTRYMMKKKIIVITPGIKILITKYMASSFVGIIMLGISSLTIFAILSSPVWFFNLDGLTLYEHLEFLKNKFFNFFFNIPSNNPTSLVEKKILPRLNDCTTPTPELDIEKDLQNTPNYLGTCLKIGFVAGVVFFLGALCCYDISIFKNL